MESNEKWFSRVDLVIDRDRKIKRTSKSKSMALMGEENARK